jgi:hypothetical protein
MISNNPRSNVRLPRLARAGAVALALASALGCTAYSTYKPPVPPDCSVMNLYDIDNIDAEFMMAWNSKDNTPGSTMGTDAGTIADGPLCGDGNVLAVKGDHNNDWGSLFGFYAFGKKDESTREGLSFWARAPGNTGKGFTILLDDPNTYNPYAGATCTADAGSVPPGDGGSFCTTYCTLDAGAGGTPPTYGPDGTLLSSGTSVAPPPANACGNEYSTEVMVTRDWQFYTIPFDQFQQTPSKPNRVPNAVFKETGTVPGTPLMTSAIMNMIFRFPKESAEDLWLSHLGFYRKKVAGAPPADGGGDRCSGC